jgi:hypothetical protein
LRRRLVVAVLAAAIGRGYRGQHRLVAAALGLAPELVVVSAAADSGPVPREVGFPSIAPRLRVVPLPHQGDLLADTMPHPVVTLFPLAPVGADQPAAFAEHAVWAAEDADREHRATAGLAAGDPAEYRGRHSGQAAG